MLLLLGRDSVALDGLLDGLVVRPGSKAVFCGSSDVVKVGIISKKRAVKLLSNAMLRLSLFINRG